MGVDGELSGLGPALLSARTVNVYGLPLVSPPTVHVSGTATALTVHDVAGASTAVTVYVRGAPPVPAGVTVTTT